mgnify:CR=1 FL=1
MLNKIIGIFLLCIIVFFLKNKLTNWVKSIISSKSSSNNNYNDNINTISKTSPIKESEKTNDTELPEYIFSKTFQGNKDNYVFKTEVYDNPSGDPLYIYKTGYYRDNYNL